MKLPCSKKSKIIPVLAGLALGSGLLLLSIANKQTPSRVETDTVARPVSYIEAKFLPFRLEARGNGVAQPAERWQVVANVAGRVVQRHPDLESGTMMAKGTLMIALDPSRYQLALAEAQADKDSLAADIAKLETEQNNTRRLLALEQQRLVLSETDLSRMQKLSAKGTVAFAQLDEQKRFTLAQRQAVISLENALALYPTTKQRLLAQQQRAAVRVNQARQDLADTRFYAPYDLRVDHVNSELHQYINPGQQLLSADSIAASEIEVRVPLVMMRRLMGESVLQLKDALPLTDFSLLQVQVTLVGSPDVEWSGKVVRIANGLEPETRTIRVIVRVDNPYQDASPLNHPPLQPDMYTQVTISTPAAQEVIAVPSHAVHAGEIWLVGENNQLQRRKVMVDFEQHDLAIIASGLISGDKVVTDDLPMAIQGSLLIPTHNTKLERDIAARAIGVMP